MSGPHRKVWPAPTHYSRVEPLYIRGEASYALAALAGGLAVAALALLLVVAMFWTAP